MYTYNFLYRVEKMKKKLGAAAALLALIAVIAVLMYPKMKKSEPAEPAPEPARPVELVTVHEPTCTQAGYTLYENPDAGTTRVEDGAPALGHDFGDPAGEKCLRCGIAAEEDTAANLIIPRVEFTGSMAGISKSTRVPLGFHFAAGDREFSCWSFTTWQGHSTLNYDKKNYTIRLFADEAITEKYKLVFNDWQLEHKYILKANYCDPSQARNLVAARIWGDMAQTRPNLPARLAETSNFGAVDGFPVSLWHDGEFKGLYTMNLHKDEDLFGLRDGTREAILISNAQTMDESLFRAPAAFIEDKSDWELEYCATDTDDAWVKESFNELIRFVMESDDKTFQKDLGKYLDVDGAIDYLIYIYALGLSDAGAKDLVLVKYEDTPWIPSVYDMEDAFGLSPDGKTLIPAGEFLPGKQDGTWSSGTGSLLWDRLLNAFAPQVTARYRALRQDILSAEALCARVSGYIASIPDELYREDALLYPNRNLPDIIPEEQMIQYINDRLPILDQIFAEG